jgi:hypothetical protein
MKKTFMAKAKKKKTGTAGDVPEKWPYMKSMEFLLSVPQQRPSVSSIPKVQQ